MLHTPYGAVRLFMDGAALDDKWQPAGLKPAFRGVDGAWRLEFAWENDGKAHRICCIFEGESDKSCPESGEDFEAVTFCRGRGMLTIGCEADFTEISSMDFGGDCLENGIMIDIRPDTLSRTFRFGAAWLEECTAETDSLTWLAADPAADE